MSRQPLISFLRLPQSGFINLENFYLRDFTQSRHFRSTRHRLSFFRLIVNVKHYSTEFTNSFKFCLLCHRWQASQADVAVFEAVGKAPAASNAHVLRWYNHIKSQDLKSLPGVKKAPGIFGGSDATPAAKAAPAKPAADDDDDVDLFGSDEEEDAEAAKVREERLKAYAEKKSKKPTIIAKSSIVLDVKPWDDETDMKDMEKQVRSIAMDGLVWGACEYFIFPETFHDFYYHWYVIHCFYS